jgi:hypothetical protein
MSQTFPRMWQLDYPIIKPLRPIGPSAVNALQCKSKSKSQNKFSWWASMLDSCIDGYTINSRKVVPLQA